MLCGLQQERARTLATQCAIQAHGSLAISKKTTNHGDYPSVPCESTEGFEIRCCASGERRRRVSSGRTSAIAARGALAEHSLLFVTELYRHGGSWEHIQVASAKPERAEARQWALKLFCSLGDVGLEFRERDNPGLFSKWAAFSADEHGGYLRLTMLSEGVAVENGTWAEIDRALRGQIHSIVDQLSEGLSEAKILIETMSREEIAFWALNAELVKRGLDKAKEVIGSG